MAYNLFKIGTEKGVNPSAIVDHSISYATEINDHTHKEQVKKDEDGKPVVGKVEFSLANGKHLIAELQFNQDGTATKESKAQVTDALKLIEESTGAAPAPAAKP